MKKKLCNHCIGTCDTPDVHCEIRLHMSICTLRELLLILKFSINHLNMLNNLNISYDGNEDCYLQCAQHWYEHLYHLSLSYDSCRNFAKNGRKFIVERLHGYM